MAMETKERILDVAEHLFANAGFASTSLRDITSEAGVNLASVNYHFGSKEGLLSAVLYRRFGPINERRLLRLDAIEQRYGTKAPPLEDILRAFFTPPFELRAELGEQGATFTRLLGRVHTETNEDFRRAFVQRLRVVFLRFTAATQRALPSLDAAELNTRMWFLIGSMAYTMMWGETVGLDEKSGREPEAVLESLIEFGAAGLSAPRHKPRGTARGRKNRGVAGGGVQAG